MSTLMAMPALASDVTIRWLPGSTAAWESESVDLYYQGVSGSLVGGLSEGDAPGIPMGPALDVDRATETLYVYFLSDAHQAEFEPPSRILGRYGHEVLVATPGPVPQLTRESSDRLQGISQPIRITWAVHPGTSHPPGDPSPRRGTDPVIQDMVDGLDPTTFAATWQTLEDFGTRYTLAPENELATQWILDQFLSFGLDAEFHLYWQDGYRRNVVATLPGMVDPSRVIYLTAHLDSRSGTPYACAPGADDDGSGTAAVIEAARVVSQYLFDYTVKFVCFNGEEQGLRGSAAYVSEMAAAGEDILGVLNMDMIAYRGTDPAPPDLVIYTDPNSVPVATTLFDAVNAYLPGILEPIVIEESVTASDHASFWAHGYPAVFVIEDEVFGGDFSPWYHTCDDLIANYPPDYVVSCARANLGGLAVLARPFDLGGPALVFERSVVDDDATGGSIGDGDGTVNPGETIELQIDLRNAGGTTASGVSGQLVSNDPAASVLVGNASWPDIPGGEIEGNPIPFVCEISGSLADGAVLPFTLNVTDQAGTRPIDFELPVRAPVVTYHLTQPDDRVLGNASGIVDPGEMFLLPLSLFNRGGKDADDVVSAMSSLDPHITVVDSVGTAALIPSGAAVELTPAYRVQVSPAATVGEVLALDLAISSGPVYQTTARVTLKVGTLFFDDAEHEGAWSLSSVSDDAFTGQWVRVDPIGTMLGGEDAQPENDHTPTPGVRCFVTGQHIEGLGPGSADVDGGRTTLTSPLLDVSAVDGPRVSYWRWYTNDLSGNPGQDEWVVQITNDAGASWVDLERTTDSINHWSLHSFLIEEHVVPTDQVMVRFMASDDANDSLVEAAVDDFEITDGPAPVGVPAPVVGPFLELGRPRPTPVRDRSTIAFSVPGQTRAHLAIFDVSGRLVRTLVDGPLTAGVHQVTWDARTDGGARVAPGVYYARLRAGALTRSQRTVVLR